MPSQDSLIRFALMISLLSWTSSSFSHQDPISQKLAKRGGVRELFGREYEENLHRDFSHPQAPLQNPADPSTASHNTAVLEIERIVAFGFPFFVVNIALGTPPQPFALLLDLQYGGAPVRSVNCTNWDCGDRPFTYNHSASSTSHGLGLRFGVPVGGHVATGSLFRDTMHMASLKVENATVGDTDKSSGENLLIGWLAQLCDGALGLARPNRTSLTYWNGFEGVRSHPNVLYELTTSGALSHNIITLRLPKNKNERGSLTLGKEAPLAKHRIALSDTIVKSTLGEGWLIPFSRLQFDSHTPFDIALDALVAISLEPDFALSLAPELVDVLYEYLGAVRQAEGLDVGIIDCALRESLPDLTLTLGGQPITLTWRDYTGVWIYDGKRFCAVNIMDHWSKDNSSAVLGMALLMNFDISFDMERNEVGLIEP